MITHLSSGARKKLKDLNQQVGEHVYAISQLYAPIFIFKCLIVQAHQLSTCLQPDNTIRDSECPMHVAQSYA
jgi:hypothetical protein